MILKEHNWKEIAVTIGVANFNRVWGDKAANLKNEINGYRGGRRVKDNCFS